MNRLIQEKEEADKRAEMMQRRSVGLEGADFDMYASSVSLLNVTSNNTLFLYSAVSLKAQCAFDQSII